MQDEPRATVAAGMPERRPRRTCSIPEASEALGIGRAAGYEAARRGDIPTLRIGRRLVVPLAALDRLLGGDAPRP